MADVRQSDTFADWLNALRDERARARIVIRIRRLELGNPGDVKAIGEGVFEIRVDYGPGYRVYFVQQGHEIVVLLCGGDNPPSAAISKRRSGWRKRFEMALKTTKFDVQDYLKTPEERATYLEAAFEDGDPTLIAEALGDVGRAMGMTLLARETGLTREGLYKALSEKGDPQLSTLMSVTKALGLRLSVAPAD
jgi:probable addiction module antidote protein/putative addiction module killer protein